MPLTSPPSLLVTVEQLGRVGTSPPWRELSGLRERDTGCGPVGKSKLRYGHSDDDAGAGLRNPDSA